MGPKWFIGTMEQDLESPAVAMPLVMDFLQPFFIDIILVFFFVNFKCSPAPITSEVSVLQLGQYLDREHGKRKRGTDTLGLAPCKEGCGLNMYEKGTPISANLFIKVPLHIPIRNIRYSFQLGGQAPQVVCHVTFVTEDLHRGVVLPSTDVTCAVLALSARVVLAVVTVWLLHACRTSPTACPVPCRLGTLLDTKNLVNELDLDFFRGIAVLAVIVRKSNPDIQQNAVLYVGSLLQNNA